MDAADWCEENKQHEPTGKRKTTEDDAVPAQSGARVRSKKRRELRVSSARRVKLKRQKEQNV